MENIGKYLNKLAGKYTTPLDLNRKKSPEEENVIKFIDDNMDNFTRLAKNGNYNASTYYTVGQSQCAELRQAIANLKNYKGLELIYESESYRDGTTECGILFKWDTTNPELEKSRKFKGYNMHNGRNMNNY